VDTGGWFSHKKFLVPPHRLHSAAEHYGDFAVNLDKSQIETLPPYHEADLQSQEKWKRYEKRYDTAWHAGPVQHRRDRITMSPRHPTKCRNRLGRLAVS
jgi:hypothetical protein